MGPASNRVKEIFAEALATPRGGRRAELNRLCDGDEDLRARVEALLAAHDGAGVFMAEPTAHPDTPSGEAGAQIGQTLGAFRLEKVIGEGGFGTVFLGRQEEPIRRLVAVKVLKPGMDSRQVIARFEAERHTLAMMEHEGIAKVIDAGTTESGRPFVAMEYVPGEFVTEYCDRKRLTIDQRLVLFDRICQAVQHAHQKGVIHRDLKPSNILVMEVDGQPVPKIIDFGIAKALAAGQAEGASRLTHGRQLLGTPEYMSPEQASGEDLDTRSDVYSLGVLLYELLCGASPFDRQLLRRAGPAQLERILWEDQPARPSTRLAGQPDAPHAAAMRRAEPQRLVRELRGDLDWIVMRAMEKDPDRRYATANALRADIRRRLNDQPVEAGPPSPLYIAGKFLKRRRAAAIGVGTAALVIIAALILASIGFLRARNAGMRAEGALEQSERQLRASLLAQARATRRTDAPGRRFESLAAIAAAAAKEPTVELRSDAIAALGLADIRLLRQLERPNNISALGLDHVDRWAESRRDGYVRIIEAKSLEEIAALPIPTESALIKQFSPSGRYLAISVGIESDAGAIVWDLERLTTVVELPNGFQASAMSLGGFDAGQPVALIGTTDGALRTYSLPDGSAGPVIQAPIGWKQVALSPDGQLVAMTMLEDPEVTVYDIRTGNEWATLEASAPILNLRWSRDGRYLAGGATDFSLCIWEPELSPGPRRLQGHQGQPVTLEFDPHEPILATSGWDNLVRLWDVEAGAALVGAIENQRLVGFGDALLTASANLVGVWEYEPGDEVLTLTIPERLGVRASLALEAEAMLAATGGATGVTLWDLAAQRPVAKVVSDEALSVGFVDHGRRLLTLHEDGVRSWGLQRTEGQWRIGPEVRLWSAEGDMRMGPGRSGDEVLVAGPAGVAVIGHEDGQVRAELSAYGGIATTPSISAEGLVFTGNWKGRAGYLRSLDSGETLLEVEGEHVVGQLSPDGRLLVVGTGREFVCYRTASKREVWRLERDNTDALAGMLGFSADGSILALGRSRFMLDLVRPESGSLIATIESPAHQAFGAIAWSADRGMLAIATTLNRLQVVDLRRVRAQLADLGLDWVDSPGTGTMAP